MGSGEERGKNLTILAAVVHFLRQVSRFPHRTLDPSGLGLIGVKETHVLPQHLVSRVAKGVLRGDVELANAAVVIHRNNHI